jgi:gamma-glutamyl hydrolase
MGKREWSDLLWQLLIYCRQFFSVLLPGGATWFNQSNGYAEAGKHIYDIAIEMNEQQQYFPLWGTCLGFELLTYLSADEVEHRAHCASTNQALPLVFKADFAESRLFKNAPKTVVKILESEAVTANFHQYCVTAKVQITKHFHVFMVSQHANQITTSRT